jgi:hypothetical protein
MKIDTKIRHVTKPGINLFLELGFPPDKAKRLYAASKKQMCVARPPCGPARRMHEQH